MISNPNSVHSANHSNGPSQAAKNLLAELGVDASFDADFVIQNYPHFIERYFESQGINEPRELCEQAEIPYAFAFHSFALHISFREPVTLDLHSESMVLSSAVKRTIEKFGLVSFQNAVLKEEIRQLYHLNNFAHLNFHRDRNDVHKNKYSLYTRDPINPDQIEPRSASTLFVDNAVAYLQGVLEGLIDKDEKGRRSHYEIFKSTNLTPLFDRVILNHQWDAPRGQGEIVVINNNSLLHSSYKRSGQHGYAIGARYLE